MSTLKSSSRQHTCYVMMSKLFFTLPEVNKNAQRKGLVRHGKLYVFSNHKCLQCFQNTYNLPSLTATFLWVVKLTSGGAKNSSSSSRNKCANGMSTVKSTFTVVIMLYLFSVVIMESVCLRLFTVIIENH